MSILQLHRSAVAACGNPPAILSVPGDCWLRGTSGSAGEGDILPYVSHQVDWRLREQWAHCERTRKSSSVYIHKVALASCGHAEAQTHLQPSE